MLAMNDLCEIHGFQQRLLLILIGYGFSETYCAHTSYACVTGNPNCIIFNITCGPTERIQILEANYGYSKPNTCKGNSQKLECEQCCVMGAEDEKNLYSLNNQYDLQTECSWKDRCTPRTASDSKNAYSAVSYDCITEENTARFCMASNTSKEKISVVFENITYFSNEELVVCKCYINSTGNFTMKALDLRLQNADGHCIDKNEVSLTDEKINCTRGHEVQNASHLTNGLKEMTLLLTFDPVNKPQMILFAVQGDSNSTITAQCFAPNQMVPTTTETSSTIPGNNSTVSSLSSPVTTAHSSSTIPSQNSTLDLFSTSMTSATSDTTGASTTSTGTTATRTSTKPNQTSSSDSPVFNVHTKDSDGVPVAGIVVPLIVLFLGGVGFVVILWRKRCKKNLETKFSNQDNTGTTTVDNVIHNAAYFCAPLETSDNDMIMEPKKTTYHNVETTSHDYFVLEPQNCALNTVKREEIQCPEYLELEPNDTYTSIDPDDVNIQTSADDEYNMINQKEKIIIRDPNYGALNFRMDAKTIKDNREYSHFQTMPNDKTKSNVSEYSQVLFNKRRPNTSDSKRSNDISLSITSSAKTLIVNSEENDGYSHLNIK